MEYNGKDPQGNIKNKSIGSHLLNIELIKNMVLCCSCHINLCKIPQHNEDEHVLKYRPILIFCIGLKVPDTILIIYYQPISWLILPILTIDMNDTNIKHHLFIPVPITRF